VRIDEDEVCFPSEQRRRIVPTNDGRFKVALNSLSQINDRAAGTVMPMRTISHLVNPQFTALVLCVLWFALVRVYYQFKPIIPRRAQLAFRRRLANRQRRVYSQLWPIFEPAARAPAGWTGWLHGLTFALVLTHDVESPKGVEQVRQLAELEMSLGFRSSFNFIPEGAYRVPEDLRRWLTENGFEVGVHDHRHDGKLYRSWRRFRASADRINHFLREWNAVGFRSGFMMRNLTWMHELDIAYDSSTFDTDPFEPQPEGAGTIFPFWVSRKQSGKGFVEMPYTLAQDSTLFLVLQEESNEIWKKKLKWIAAHGGMAMVNVHPDYIAFGDKSCRWDEYSASRYGEFLQWVKQEFAGRYWHALPRDIAAYYRQAIQANSTAGPGETSPGRGTGRGTGSKESQA